MKQNLPSLTAATVAVISSLRWYTPGNQNAILQAELLRNLPRRFMIPFVWIYIQIILLHPLICKFYLYFLLILFGKSQLCQGVWSRKAYMEQQVRNFLHHHKQHPHSSSSISSSNGDSFISGNFTARVIVLAAGYDMLAFRLAHEFPNVMFIELDHPATGEAKLSALSCMCKNSKGRLTQPKNLLFCHEALGENGCTIRDALERNGIQLVDERFPTVVVMEGLSFYLTEKENKHVFQEIGQLFGSSKATPEEDEDEDGGSLVVAFDFFNLDRHGRPINPNTTMHPLSSWVSSAMKYKVAIVGEPFKWGIAPEGLAKFFENTGWQLLPTADADNDLDAAQLPYAISMGIEYAATVKWAP
mmetsp:Transcript_15866/g.29950  ORF Transcript_15866/g.29950 Transcript_15866/m.29950 type:complete len:358 (-) Transcript_15866:28-1101(-)